MNFLEKNLIEKNKLLVICGPTCVGKSSLAIELAKILHTDIISVDSMQAYRGLDIGTDKTDTRAGPVKQYMIDIVDPDYHLTVLEFRDLARDIIENKFFTAGKIPILVGGSGLHLRCITEDLIEAPYVGPDIRQKVKKDVKEEGIKKSYEKLLEMDPDYAKKIGVRDEKRIIRALEVIETCGRPFSSFQTNWQKRESIYNTIFLGISADREKIYKDIGERVEKMFQKGLVEEVKTLKAKGTDKNISISQAIGYKEVIELLDKRIDFEECKEKIKKNTRNLAKKQMTWFKSEKRISWIDANVFDINKLTNQILKKIGDIIYDEDN
jgi:tRNA dimethylallyltransferase